VTTWAHFVWYIDRAAGYTALVLLTVSILLGLLLGLKIASPHWPRFLTNDVHEHITLMALVFVAIHGFAILIDPFMRFGWRDVLVPFGSAYHPMAMALGIVAGYLALAIWLSSRVRKQIGFRMWRRLHYATFLVYVFAVAHTLLIGNDRSTIWGRGVLLASVALVVALTAIRVATSGPDRPAEVVS
jgi:sulfoxide reductase heme-binding subunit YedZ